eukprot:gene19572-biopygen13035
MVFEPSGACGPAARDVFRKLIRTGCAPPDEDPRTFAHRLRQRWCVLVCRQAAQVVLRRGGATSAASEEESPQVALAVSTAARREEIAVSQILATRRAPPTAITRAPAASFVPHLRPVAPPDHDVLAPVAAPVAATVLG